MLLIYLRFDSSSSSSFLAKEKGRLNLPPSILFDLGLFRVILGADDLEKTVGQIANHYCCASQCDNDSDDNCIHNPLLFPAAEFMHLNGQHLDGFRAEFIAKIRHDGYACIGRICRIFIDAITYGAQNFITGASKPPDTVG